MKIKEDFILRKIVDDYVVVPVGAQTVNFNGMITLNETGAFLFENMQKEISKEELIDKMMEEYDVDKDRASSDIDKFVSKLKSEDLLED